jgi:serine/threonine protein kinase
VPEAVAFNPEQRPCHEAPAIPDHTLLRCIGSGSYGEVWLARNVLGSYRAVKVIYRRSFEHDRPYEREFEGIQKFEPISRSHESQVAILHVGRNDDAGYFYYVMELADDANSSAPVAAEVTRLTSNSGDHGPPTESDQSLLTSAASYQPRTLKLDLHQRTQLPVSECIEIGLALCHALQHLHGHELVHRDIKPSNIIFVNGVPKLADIGLVASMDATMSFVGTSGFLPPEGPGTRQGDIYSLGKVLYEVSTGRDRQDYPELPAEWRTSEERERLLEFNQIVLKACESDVRQRYASADAMLIELELLQRGGSVRHSRMLTKRWARTRKAATIIGLSVVVVIAASYWKSVFAGANKKHHSEDTNEKRRVISRESANAEARRLFEKGKKSINTGTREGFTEGVALLNQAVLLDSDYVDAHVTLANAYRSASDWHLPSKQAMTQAKVHAMRALELDPSRVSAHISLGWIQMFYDWDWKGAEQTFRHATNLAPKEAFAHNGYATCLTLVGRKSEAEMERQTARQLAPDSFALMSDMVWHFYDEHEYDKGIEQCKRLLAKAPSFHLSHMFLAMNYRERGQFQDALSEIRKARRADDGVDLMAMEGNILALMGARDEALRIVDELERLALNRHVSSYFVAMVFAGLDDKERTIGYLEKAFDERSSRLPDVSKDPVWDRFRNENEFKALVQKLGLAGSIR